MYIYIYICIEREREIWDADPVTAQASGPFAKILKAGVIEDDTKK